MDLSISFFPLSLSFFLTLHVKMDPRTICRRVGRSIKEIDLTLIPSLVGLLYIGQIERGTARERGTALIAFAGVRRIAIVPEYMCVCLYIVKPQERQTRKKKRRRVEREKERKTKRDEDGEMMMI